jgi:FkbM family methyltransferase
MIKKFISNARKVKLRLENLTILDRTKLYEVWEQQQLKRIFDRFDIDCVFDVGANYGQYANMLRKKCGYKGLIISFEPMPNAAMHLRELSSRDPLWIVKEIALSDKKGETSFNIMVGSQFSSISEPVHSETNLFTKNNKVEQTIIVKTDILNNAYAELLDAYSFKRPFLKLDTQGFDVSIIKHAKDCIDSFIGLQSELAVKKLYSDSVYFFDAIKFYESFGFVLSSFVPNNAGHFPLLVETDCLMINEKHLDSMEKSHA